LTRKWVEIQVIFACFTSFWPLYYVHTNFDYVVAQVIAQYCSSIDIYIRLENQQSVGFEYWRGSELECSWFLPVLPCFGVCVRTHFDYVVAKVIAQYCSNIDIYIRLENQWSIGFEYWRGGELECRWFLLFYLVFASTGEEVIGWKCIINYLSIFYLVSAHFFCLPTSL
jgi:hypothetical protein